MPQMSPMWWTMLMLMFNITLISSMAITYFNYKKLMMKNSLKLKKKMNWTW
uniref:ATP synthase F0 subunit 8 n=1 Tax=Bolanusoides shaanxiensis TaxID=2691008 RepID=A0A6B9LVL3_9HEMI|nr:ATP synthase F0 subunit 8 [Bolanusoides shaanxiensis]